jgi:hypothetical protein
VVSERIKRKELPDYRIDPDPFLLQPRGKVGMRRSHFLGYRIARGQGQVLVQEAAGIGECSVGRVGLLRCGEQIFSNLLLCAADGLAAAFPFRSWQGAAVDHLTNDRLSRIASLQSKIAPQGSQCFIGHEAPATARPGIDGIALMDAANDLVAQIGLVPSCADTVDFIAQRRSLFALENIGDRPVPAIAVLSPHRALEIRPAPRPRWGNRCNRLSQKAWMVWILSRPGVFNSLRKQGACPCQHGGIWSVAGERIQNGG